VQRILLIAIVAVSFIAACGTSSTTGGQMSPSIVAAASPTPSPSLAPEPQTADEVLVAVQGAMAKKIYKLHWLDKTGAETKVESKQGPPGELTIAGFVLTSTLSPTPPQAATGCEGKPCWMLSSTNSYPNGSKAVVHVWVDKATKTVLRIEQDVTGAGKIGFYALKFEY
jgi:hypothetical protein